MSNLIFQFIPGQSNRRLEVQEEEEEPKPEVTQPSTEVVPGIQTKDDVTAEYSERAIDVPPSLLEQNKQEATNDVEIEEIVTKG